MRVLALEFNELCPPVLDRLIASGDLPNFARLRDSSLAVVTDAEERAPRLEPWIQWVTVHTGQSYAQHRCFTLNDGGTLATPRIWDLVCRAGGSAWVCGSMNAGIEQATFRGHFLPDPWATGSHGFPAGVFEPYLDLVRRYVQEHSASPQIEPAAYVRFARFMIGHGLSAPTVWTALRQLASERGKNLKWRRALILDRMQWDMFRSVYRSSRPDFATFFINSTAHLQHFHWREMEPEIFTVKPSAEDQETFGSAIADGYRNMDRIVGQALALAGPDTCVVLLTGLSQQPMLIHEDQGGRRIFRHRDIDRLLAFAGVEAGWRYAPVMSQQFLLHFDSDEAAAAAAQRIEGLRLGDGRPAMWARQAGSKLDAGCVVDQDPGQDAEVSSTRSNEAIRFHDLFYPLGALRSGMHDPAGVFWIRAPGVQPGRVPGRIPLRQVAPTLAAIAGVEGTFDLEPLAPFAAAAPEPLAKVAQLV